ncbi:hypothetical protein Hanom_Chr06g00537071 [Helianthus anomalus]
MTSVEEALIDRINHLSVGLEGCLQEVNLSHQRLNILASPPMVPIIAQRGWNVIPKVIIPARWNIMPTEPPLDVLHGVPVRLLHKTLWRMSTPSFSLKYRKVISGFLSFLQHLG